jgi:DNA-binding transcriptional LysR family regulator
MDLSFRQLEIFHPVMITLQIASSASVRAMVVNGQFDIGLRRTRWICPASILAGFR